MRVLLIHSYYTTDSLAFNRILSHRCRRHRRAFLHLRFSCYIFKNLIYTTFPLYQQLCQYLMLEWYPTLLILDYSSSSLYHANFQSLCYTFVYIFTYTRGGGTLSLNARQQKLYIILVQQRWRYATMKGTLWWGGRWVNK